MITIVKSTASKKFAEAWSTMYAREWAKNIRTEGR